MTALEVLPNVRLWARIDQRTQLNYMTGCWEWTGGLTEDGYGRIWVDGRYQRAHRAAYTAVKGPIPEGYEIDHLCDNRRCCRPSHLEAVTGAVNTARAKAHNGRKTHCPANHPYDDANTYRRASGQRECRTCRREQDRRRTRKPRTPARTPGTAAAVTA